MASGYDRALSGTTTQTHLVARRPANLCQSSVPMDTSSRSSMRSKLSSEASLLLLQALCCHADTLQERVLSASRARTSSYWDVRSVQP
jgi:hypothetical protein